MRGVALLVSERLEYVSYVPSRMYTDLDPHHRECTVTISLVNPVRTIPIHL